VSTAREQLKHKLKVVAGLPPWSPTDEELDLVIADVAEVAERREPTEADWRASARRRVRGAGQYKYAGEDMSNLNMLLYQILAQGNQGGRSSGKG
jgi:hypothetical protein